MLKMILQNCKWHSNNTNNNCRCQSTTSEKSAWNVDDYHQLYQTGQNILNTVLSNLEAASSHDTVIGVVPGTNVPNCVHYYRVTKNIYSRRSASLLQTS